MNINDIQRLILSVVDDWVKTQKTPIPQQVIVSQVMIKQPIPDSTIRAATRVLVKKGYIRRSASISRTVTYIQLRTV